MKTQLIPLEPHDDLISIRDKMSWAKTPRILLVWPARGRVDVRPLDLALLHRHAEALGAELGLVTRNAEIRQAARQMKLPVFSTTKNAQRKPWPERQPARPSRRFPKMDFRALRAALPAPELFNFSGQPVTRIAAFSVGVLAVLLVALIFLPSAEIRIAPPAQPQSVTISISAETNAWQVQISGVIPARQKTLTLELTDSKASSGKALFPDEPASGMARFTNLTALEVALPAKLVILTRSTTPLRFETVKEARLPAGNGKSVDVPIRAVQPGSVGNLPANALVVFENPLGLTLLVTNPEPTSGGSDAQEFTPTEADRQALRERLLANLKSQALRQFPEQLQPGAVFFPASFELIEILDETYAPAPGQPGDALTLTLKAEFRASYASAADLEELARLVLDASTPAGYEAAPGSLTVEPVSALFGGAQGVTRWQVRAQRLVRQQIDSGQVIALVQGKTVKSAEAMLQQSFGLAAVAQIKISPFFWPWLPSLPFRITVAN